MEGIELLRLKNDKAMRQELWMGWLPQEMLRLSEELSFVDKILSDERFFEPFRERFNTRTGRPTVPVEVYVRLMYLKARYGLGYETLVKEVSDSIS
jgi:IS5 family transposase